MHIYTYPICARASTNLARVNRGRGGARTHGAKRAWRATKLFAKERLIAQRAKSEKRERVKAKAHMHCGRHDDTQKDSFSLYRTLRILLQSACAKTVYEYACAAEGVGGGGWVRSFYLWVISVRVMLLCSCRCSTRRFTSLPPKQRVFVYFKREAEGKEGKRSKHTICVRETNKKACRAENLMRP